MYFTGLTIYFLHFRMPLTAAEKQRRYREKRDEDSSKRQAYLEKRKGGIKRRKKRGREN